MIVVTGATGQLGRQIVEGLLNKLPGTQIGISVRDPEKAEDFKQRGVRICKADFADPAGLAGAFDGAEQILMVSVNKFGEEAVRLAGNAIQAAKKAGAKRILYTSHQGASASSAFVPAQGHAATEALLAASGVPYVSLRNGFYAESALFQLGSLKQAGKISLPEDWPRLLDLTIRPRRGCGRCPHPAWSVRRRLTAFDRLTDAGLRCHRKARLGDPRSRDCARDRHR